jgi:hypothetical protein
MQAKPIRRVQLTRIRPEHRERRFYRLEIVTDLFGTARMDGKSASPLPTRVRLPRRSIARRRANDGADTGTCRRLRHVRPNKILSL